MSEAQSESGKAANGPGRDSSKTNEEGAIVIKKYANRRLYNTGTSSYVTLDYLSEMVKNGELFVVYDAKTGDDITRSVLTQIIFEEESKGQNLLPIQFLRQLIQFYGDSLQSFVPSYLEMSMDAFARNQEKIRSQMRETFGSTPGYSMFEEGARQNMALFERAMKMFTPTGAMFGAAGRAASDDAGDDGASAAELTALKAELAELREQLSTLKKD